MASASLLRREGALQQVGGGNERCQFGRPPLGGEGDGEQKEGVNVVNRVHRGLGAKSARRGYTVCGAQGWQFPGASQPGAEGSGAPPDGPPLSRP